MDKANNIKRLLAFVAVVAALALIVTIFVRSRGGKAPALVPRLPVKVGVSLSGIHFTETREGVKKWDLSADRAEYNRETNKTSLFKVRLLITDKSAGDFKVTAERAEYDHATKNVRLTGHVEGDGSKGTHFATESLTYLAAPSRLETGDKVNFSDRGMTVEGVGMKFWTQTRRLQLLSAVAAEFGGRR
ncbi:LPS export ABC transporter periplasmic protein LptC [Geomesophilobacter sediminis]|uniref:LPS export ABC transporter periplasmic protein LptC n=1 Tax=Geomesophilobacter sediminis TaxID=2798584 RepID=A0A8J7JED5_9BACT|nr:LPS export ABC transporter periplasmic protein LptC [Geomesophilobacter sediminis]MBJ6725933.1 LPS export ABC transporter periplasmic protein LptC [Geomesophilobacter sediminis]